MTLAEITSAFPSIKDWEDSYLNDGRQRLLGKSDQDNIAVEIIITNDVKVINLLSDQINYEILGCVDLITNNTKLSLKFLEDAATFSADNPNTHFQKTLEGYLLDLVCLQTKDSAIYSLNIQPTADPQQSPEK